MNAHRKIEYRFTLTHHTLLWSAIKNLNMAGARGSQQTNGAILTIETNSKHYDIIMEWCIIFTRKFMLTFPSP